jgi:hypothetical protein
MAEQLSENSRQGFATQNPPCIGPESDLSRNLRWGCRHVYDETPVGLAVYVRNDPVNMIDPDGRDTQWAENGYTITVTVTAEISLLDAIPNLGPHDANIIYVDGFPISSNYVGPSLDYIKQGLAMANAALAQQQPVYCARQVRKRIKSAYTEAVRDNGFSHSPTSQLEKGFAANAKDGTAGRIVSGDRKGRLVIPTPPGTTDTFHTHSNGPGMPSTPFDNVSGTTDRGDTLAARFFNVYVISRYGLAIAPMGAPVDGSQSYFVFSGDDFDQWYKALLQSCSPPPP